VKSRAVGYAEGAMDILTETEKRAQIGAAVEEVAREMAPWVRRIRFKVDEDWTGQETVFLRVLLSDEAVKDEHRMSVVNQVRRKTSERIIPRFDLFPHFNFRSESEQEEMKDPAWD
jgi:hypothetical protein